jgi:hypothetical protein
MSPYDLGPPQEDDLILLLQLSNPSAARMIILDEIITTVLFNFKIDVVILIQMQIFKNMSEDLRKLLTGDDNFYSKMTHKFPIKVSSVSCVDKINLIPLFLFLQFNPLNIFYHD